MSKILTLYYVAETPISARTGLAERNENKSSQVASIRRISCLLRFVFLFIYDRARVFFFQDNLVGATAEKLVAIVKSNIFQVKLFVLLIPRSKTVEYFIQFFNDLIKV